MTSGPAPGRRGGPTGSRRRDVAGAGGVRLRVTESGPADGGPDGVHLLLVHGYPDDASMWDDVVDHLPPDWHVVRHDVRGAGGSEAPARREAYAISCLVGDIAAVVESCVPDGARVHLAAHDWGAIQSWAAIDQHAPSSLQGRVASYTAMSGPSLDELGLSLRRRGGLRRLLKQLVLHSWYVWLFHLPRLPEWLWTRQPWWLRRVIRLLDDTTRLLDWGPQVAANARPGLELYRANVTQRIRDPRDWRSDVPTQLLIATDDPWISTASLHGLDRHLTDLRRVEVDEGHWLPRVRPGWVADQVAEQVLRQA
ncbi:alpha/beta fold hydrolase [Nocardioidaceae bacterium]|nr:alpha/beta fold hydrolase [Nocardioidaceae bacterium]